jgi:ATP/maltotriose-dependent transcriptional regulator MalT
LQRVDPHMGVGAAAAAASPLPVSSVLTSLLNDIAQQPDALMLVLDDYHAVDSRPIDEALTFLLDNLPPQAASGDHLARGSQPAAGPSARARPADGAAGG